MELEKRVEERTSELYEAKERVEAILASVGDGVVVTDLERTIITVNSAYVKQSGFATQDLIGHKYNELLSEQNSAGRLAELETAMIQKRPWSGELLQKKKSGGQYEVQHTIAPVVSQEGAVIGYVSSIRDITQQKELDRLKDQFISDVSHELRTPVTNLSLYLDLLETAQPDKRDEYFSVLHGQCQLLDKLVEDILDLSRLEVAKTKKTPMMLLDLNQLVEQSVVSFQPLAKSSGLELDMEMDATIPTVLGNQSQLTRAISNLVGNAIRYTLEGHVCIRTFHKNGKVCIEVDDTGIGFDAEDRLHIFERFYRGKQVRQSKIHGTGLGLAIVKEIVDYHHGKIQVESELNKGSRFQIWLPVS
jgi:two-component system phosphate regulon sensor histidine kinase PhoR